MKISASQRKALEAAGYTIGKSGSTIQNKSGGTVGGYNENGKIFSGSKKVRDILAGGTEATKAATKAAPKATPKAAPKAKPVTKDAMAGYRAGDITTTSLDKPKGGRGSGAAEVSRRSADAKPTTTARTGPTKTDKMRGDARTSAASTTKTNSVKSKLREIQGQLDKNSAALAAASLGSGVLTRGDTKARGTPSNPTYGSQRPQPTGPQGRINTGVSRPARVGGAKGISGTNPARTAKQIGRGGRKNTPQDPKDFNPFLN